MIWVILLFIIGLVITCIFKVRGYYLTEYKFILYHRFNYGKPRKPLVDFDLSELDNYTLVIFKTLRRHEDILKYLDTELKGCKISGVLNVEVYRSGGEEPMTYLGMYRVNNGLISEVVKY